MRLVASIRLWICQFVHTLVLNFLKGFSSQYFPRLEFDITMNVALVWPMVFNFTTSFLEIVEIMLRSECSWAKGAKPLKVTRHLYTPLHVSLNKS